MTELIRDNMNAIQQHQNEKADQSEALQAPRCSFSEVLAKDQAQVQRRIMHQESFENVFSSPQVQVQQEIGSSRRSLNPGDLLTRKTWNS